MLNHLDARFGARAPHLRQEVRVAVTIEGQLSLRSDLRGLGAVSQDDALFAPSLGGAVGLGRVVCWFSYDREGAWALLQTTLTGRRTYSHN